MWSSSHTQPRSKSASWSSPYWARLSNPVYGNASILTFFFIYTTQAMASPECVRLCGFIDLDPFESI